MTAFFAGLMLTLAAIPADLAALRAAYDFGRYDEVSEKAEPLLSDAALTDAEQTEVLTYAALAAFNRGATGDAERIFATLLRLAPDHALDPFLAPPPALRLFESVRASLSDALAQRRKDLAQAQADRDRESERARNAVQASEKERLENLARASARRIEKRSLWVNFVPFGVAQFHQGRVASGTAFAVVQGLLAVASLTTFFVYQGLHETRQFPADNTGLGGSGVVTLSGIPVERRAFAERLRAANLGTTTALYGTWAIGTTEALLHHRGEVEVPVAAGNNPATLSVAF
ncbi:MAG: hypothetical protein ACKVPX_18470 [Myxococcaceae bacterium]